MQWIWVRVAFEFDSSCISFATRLFSSVTQTTIFSRLSSRLFFLLCYRYPVTDVRKTWGPLARNWPRLMTVTGCVSFDMQLCEQCSSWICGTARGYIAIRSHATSCSPQEARRLLELHYLFYRELEINDKILSIILCVCKSPVYFFFTKIYMSKKIQNLFAPPLSDISIKRDSLF